MEFNESIDPSERNIDEDFMMEFIEEGAHESISVNPEFSQDFIHDFITGIHDDASMVSIRYVN